MNSNNCFLTLACMMCITLFSTAGLQCYSCFGDISDSFFNFGQGDSCDPSPKNLISCEPDVAGYNSSCQLLIGRTTLTYIGRTYKYTYVSRSCGIYVASLSGCSRVDTTGEKIKLPTLSGVSFGEIQYKSCICDSDRCNNEEVRGDGNDQASNGRQTGSRPKVVFVLFLLTIFKLL